MTALIRLAELIAFLALVVCTVIFPLATLLSLALLSLVLLMPLLMLVGRPALARRGQRPPHIPELSVADALR